MSEKEISKLREMLEQAKTVITEQNGIIENMLAPPLVHAVVVALHDDDTVTVRANGGFVVMSKPVPNDKNVPSSVDGVEVKLRPNLPRELRVGDIVLVNKEAASVVGFSNPTPALGPLVAVDRVIDRLTAEISVGGNTVRVLISPDMTGDPLRDGDMVAMDSTGTMILHNAKRERERFEVTNDTGVTWDSIGGQHEAKLAMIEAVELPLKQAAIFRHYGKKQTKGVLLYGPPGCGKTMLGKAAASAVAAASGKASASSFMYVKGPELLDPYVGATEAGIRMLFQRARAHKEKHGVPAVIFVDEADALLGRRGERSGGGNMEKTVVPAFLTEMDGMDDSGAVVILATNRPDTLDSAITRDGRIDRKVRVSRPNRDEAETIFKLYLDKVPLANIAVTDAAALACDALYSESRAFYRVSLEDGAVNSFTLANLCSGAMIAGIVDQAVSMAMHRDIAGNNTRRPSGVQRDDLLSAVDRVYHQNRDIDHQDALVEFANHRTIINVQRINHAVAEAA